MSQKYRKGVGALILNNSNHIFFAKRISPHNSWQMPQGGIDEGEDPEVALFRELKEEIGTDNIEILGKTRKLKYCLPLRARQNLFNGKYRGQEQIWYVVRFLGVDSDINLNYHNQPEFIEWKWATEQEILSNIVYFKYKMYVKIFSCMKNILS